MADVAATLAAWSSTTGSNSPAGTATISTGLDDNLREIQGVMVRGLSHKGADIASATTTDLGAVEGLMHDITGTTTITGFGTVRAGIWKILKFEGILTLTHNSTSLILPGAQNITTADGDTAVFISEGSGNWRCIDYIMSSGPSEELLSSGSVSAQAALDLTFGLTRTRYKQFKILLTGIIPATTNTDLWARWSEDAGSTFKSGASDYRHARHGIQDSSATPFGAVSTGDTKWVLAGSLSNGAGRQATLEFVIDSPTSTINHAVYWNSFYQSDAAATVQVGGCGVKALNTNAVTGLRFLMSSGNITASYKIVGVR